MRSCRLLVTGFLLVAGSVFPPAATAEVEVTTPAGRRILLKDNRTWEYVDVGDKGGKGEKADEKGEATLQMERRIDASSGCRFAVRLDNTLSYEVRSLVLYYTGYRANGVTIGTVSASVSFNSLRPGELQRREVEFPGVACKEIAHVKVVGGDRCEMDDLNKFSPDKGQCLARIRVAPSDLLRFDK